MAVAIECPLAVVRVQPIRPMLASPAAQLPKGVGSSYEAKWTALEPPPS